jgi:hypothetical protein
VKAVLTRSCELVARHLESTWLKPMVSLPIDMFDDMSSLTFIHLGMFMPMTQLPSFHGLTNLRSLTLAVFLALEELPSFDRLFNLERFVMSITPMLHRLPDFAAMKDLKAFVAFDGGKWCCNGFLGACDLQNPICEPQLLWGPLPLLQSRSLAAPRAEGSFAPAIWTSHRRKRTSICAMAPCGSSATRLAPRRRFATTSASWW